MTYKLRNTIALGVVLFLISAAGIGYWKFLQPKKLNEINKKISDLNTSVKGLSGVGVLVMQKEQELKDVLRKYGSRSKIIPPMESSSDSYQDIIKGMDQAGFFKFDLRATEPFTRKSYGFNTYMLESGIADFPTLYRFIYFLENGSRLYKLNKVTMELREEVSGTETRKDITFSMQLEVYWATAPGLDVSPAARPAPIVEPPFDPFNPIIVSTLSTQVPEDEINPETIIIKGLVPGKAFVLCEKDLIILQVGDPVWRGYVSAINSSNGTVTFTLNEGGVIRSLEKTMQFTKKRGR
jgi:hypothetical protein